MHLLVGLVLLGAVLFFEGDNSSRRPGAAYAHHSILARTHVLEPGNLEII